jgi:hypothetical protein
MRTVYASLPFYDSLTKQDVTRTGAIIPIHCPQNQLPSFELCMGAGNAATVAVSTVTSVKLVTSDGVETEIISYFANPPKVYHPTDPNFNTYIKYNGAAFNPGILMPLGVYYVKLATLKDPGIYYSDYIRIDKVSVISANFTKIVFSNTDNFGNLLYEDSFAQQVWLEATLNNPSHEMVNVGEERDGIFIAEKIVSKYIYSLIAYVSRGLYSCLMRLSQHDTITITDEVGNTYTPAVGNIIVEPPEWTTYETCKLVIKFNDGENSSFGWVS